MIASTSLIVDFIVASRRNESLDVQALATAALAFAGIKTTCSDDPMKRRRNARIVRGTQPGQGVEWAVDWARCWGLEN
jgi:hypothetical protein